jgi:hypothetical protein
MSRQERAELAAEMVDSAELAVRQAENALEQVQDPTWRDILETRLREALALQDEITEATAPALEQREVELRQAVHEVMRSAAGEPGSDWGAKYRRHMSAAVKARIIRRYGRKVYEALPW